MSYKKNYFNPTNSKSFPKSAERSKKPALPFLPNSLSGKVFTDGTIFEQSRSVRNADGTYTKRPLFGPRLTAEVAKLTELSERTKAKNYDPASIEFVLKATQEGIRLGKFSPHYKHKKKKSNFSRSVSNSSPSFSPRNFKRGWRKFCKFKTSYLSRKKVKFFRFLRPKSTRFKTKIKIGVKSKLKYKNRKFNKFVKHKKKKKLKQKNPDSFNNRPFKRRRKFSRPRRFFLDWRLLPTFYQKFRFLTNRQTGVDSLLLKNYYSKRVDVARYFFSRSNLSRRFKYVNIFGFRQRRYPTVTKGKPRRTRSFVRIRPFLTTISRFLQRNKYRRRRKFLRIRRKRSSVTYSPFFRAKRRRRLVRKSAQKWLHTSRRFRAKRYPKLLTKGSMVYLYFTQKKNNIFYSFLTSKGRLLSSFSNGRTLFKGSRRMSTVASEAAARFLVSTMRNNKATGVYFVFHSRLTYLLRPVLKIFQTSNITIAGVKFVRVKPHSLGLRKRTSRRV